MKYGLNSATVGRIRSVLARFSEVDKAILYGSRAKGIHKRGSDIDLALFARFRRKRSFQNQQRTRRSLTALQNGSVDPCEHFEF